MNKKVLIVEDDEDIARLIEINLKDIHCDGQIISNGQSALSKALKNNFDLIILDIVLPKINGLDICRALRAQDVNTPVLMLTSKSSVTDRVLGLEIGADDYLTKPFSIHELQARVKAIFRRKQLMVNEQTSADKKMIKVGSLTIDQNKRQVNIDDKLINLTMKEFDLLVQFAKNPGRIYTRTELLDIVWGYNYQGYEHTVNSHINRLRAKIESNPHNPFFILTVHKLGYKFTENENTTVNANV